MIGDRRHTGLATGLPQANRKGGGLPALAEGGVSSGLVQPQGDGPWNGALVGNSGHGSASLSESESLPLRAGFPMLQESGQASIRSRDESRRLSVCDRHPGLRFHPAAHVEDCQESGLWRDGRFVG